MKKDREKRHDSLLVASIFYAAAKDNFMKAAKEQAKERLSTEIDEGMESLLGAAYKIGFADAIDYLTDEEAVSIDLGEKDEGATQESGR